MVSWLSPNEQWLLSGVQIRETPELYREVTLPYIQRFSASRIKWVHNILDKKARSRFANIEL